MYITCLNQTISFKPARKENSNYWLFSFRYYSGEKRAPLLTIFIGGNHEASNYLQELPYGGWVAPNIYYLGRAGVVQFGKLRIGGNRNYLMPPSGCKVRCVKISVNDLLTN